MSGSENMSDHLNNFFSLVDKLKEMDIVITDDLLSILLLYSIPNTYENFRCAIESITYGINYLPQTRLR